MDINQDNLTEKLQLLKLLIQKGRFGTGVSDDVDELDEFVDGESMGILALVDNKEARCILKGYGENNLVNRSFLEKYILNHCIDDSSITGITKLTILNLTIGEKNKNNIKGSANIKKNQNNSIEINSIVIINNKENINSNSKNKNIINNSENIRNKINSHIIVKEEININESVKVDSIFNRINKSITPERKINNNNSPVDFSNIINIDSDKKIKINKIKKIIKIPYIYIQNNDKNKINIYKIMMPKPEIALKEIINYSNNRVDTKRTNRNYKYKRK
ncbi:hypothetical protein H8356DRAFT_933083 [Neocallimastix lanati (nom. inval.)]|nr:hypothetical protein H8356DRAFT_933083 [Neocallimastix sp. JGI-2020a]